MVVVVQQYFLQKAYSSTFHSCPICPTQEGIEHTVFLPSRVVEQANGGIEEAVASPGSDVQTNVAGVAVTLFLGSPKWFQNRYSMMVNLALGALPKHWIVQIFYDPSKKMALEAINYPGIRKQIAKGNVVVTPLPSHLCDKRKRDVMLEPWLWQSMLAERVLIFGGTSVLCANSFHNVSSFEQYDYIGHPWGEFQGKGGGGGLSLRNRTQVHALLVESRIPPVISLDLQGQEDTVIVRHLLRNTVTLPDSEATQRFAMSELQADGASPFGAVGTLSPLSDAKRQAYLDYCPELKMFFPSLHNGACFGASPNPLQCFQYLCESGGLKCDTSGSQVFSPRNSKGKKRVTIKLEAEVLN